MLSELINWTITLLIFIFLFAVFWNRGLDLYHKLTRNKVKGKDEEIRGERK